MHDVRDLMGRWGLVRVSGVALLVLVATGCGADEVQASGGSAYVRRLHAQAVAKGYDGQAALLADGRVSFSEFREADRAAIECAKAQGVTLKATLFNDLFGPSEAVEPADTGPIDADFVNGVMEKCQKTKQELVGMAYGYGRHDLSDAAYALFGQCATKAGYTATLPRSYRAISAKLGPDLVFSCTNWVTDELMNTPG